MFILFWACVLCLFHAPHTLLMHPIIIFFLSLLSFLLLNFLLSFFVIYPFFFLKKKEKTKNVLNYKNYKEKNRKI